MLHTLAAYVFFGVCSVAMLSVLAGLVCRLRAHPAAASFAWFVIALAVWSLADVLELVGPTAAWSRFWFATVRTTAVCVSAVTWVRFCLRYTRCERTRWGRLLSWSAAIPGALFGVAAWTPLRRQLLAELEFVAHGPFWEPTLRVTGPWFDAYFCYALLCCTGGLVMLAIFVFRAGPISRWQVLWVAVAIAYTAFWAVLTALGLLGTPALDKSVFALPVTVLILAVALFFHGFLRSSPVLLQALMNTIPDAVLAVDADRYLVEANAAGLDLARRHLPGDFHSARLLHHRLDELLPQDSQLRRFLTAPAPAEGEFKVQDHRQRKVFAARKTSLQVGRRDQGALFTFRDETAARQLLEDLNGYAHRVAHDLKNPLSVIVSYSQLLREKSDSVDPQQMARGIEDAATSMRGIIDDLLLASTIEDGDLSQFSPVDLRQVAREVVDRLIKVYREARVEIQQPQGWPLIMARKAWCEEILTNLLVNAIEHGGKPAVQVTLSCRPLDGFAEVRVTDDGTGADPAALARLFELPQVIQDAAGNPRGLGLSIVRRLVEKQGGSLGVSRGQQGGTTFWFTLRISDR